MKKSKQPLRKRARPIAPPPQQPDPTRGDDVTLTPEDEAALDRAMERLDFTDEEIAASMAWYEETEREREAERKEGHSPTIPPPPTTPKS